LIRGATRCTSRQITQGEGEGWEKKRRRHKKKKRKTRKAYGNDHQHAVPVQRKRILSSVICEHKPIALRTEVSRRSKDEKTSVTENKEITWTRHCGEVDEEVAVALESDTALSRRVASHRRAQKNK
jgi:hypothetical protein